MRRSYGGAADGAATISVSSPPAPWRDLMEARTVSSLPTAAPHHDAVRCLLAIELSKAGRRRTYAAFGQDQPVHVGRLRLEGPP
jgi:hypothetical protein